MKVLQVCTYARGGAGKAALSFHRELLKQGIDASILFRTANLDEPGIHTMEAYHGTLNTKARMLRHKLYRKFKISRKQTPPVRYSFTVSPFDITHHPAYKEADLIHLHWTYELLDFPSFLKHNTKPIIWTQHDECFLLDGFHNTSIFPVETYEDYKAVFRTHLQEFFSGQSVHLTAPSTWLTAALQENKRTNNNPISLLPNGLESTIFKIQDKKTARLSLGLPESKKIVLFIADFLDRPLKGLHRFIEMIQFLETQPETSDLLFLIVGHGTVDGSLIPLDYQQIEYVAGLEKMSQLYNAADVYVSPTSADNLPYTIMESLFCGTPVAAYDVGGISDLINQGKNGLLCPFDDYKTLGKNTLRLLSENEFKDRKQISQEIMAQYDIKQVTPQLIQLYKEKTASR